MSTLTLSSDQQPEGRNAYRPVFLCYDRSDQLFVLFSLCLLDLEIASEVCDVDVAVVASDSLSSSSLFLWFFELSAKGQGNALSSVFTELFYLSRLHHRNFHFSVGGLRLKIL